MGRIYEERGTPPDLQWFWAITGIFGTPPDAHGWPRANARIDKGTARRGRHGQKLTEIES
jgi:hypothetical protein